MVSNTNIGRRSFLVASAGVFAGCATKNPYGADYQKAVQTARELADQAERTAALEMRTAVMRTLSAWRLPNGTIDPKGVRIVVQMWADATPKDRTTFEKVVKEQGGPVQVAVEQAIEEYKVSGLAKVQTERPGEAVQFLNEQKAEIFKATPAGRAMTAFQDYLKSVDVRKPFDSKGQAAFVAQVQRLVDVSRGDPRVAAELAKELTARAGAETAAAQAAGITPAAKTRSYFTVWAMTQAGAAVTQAAKMGGNPVASLVLETVQGQNVWRMDVTPVPVLAPAAPGPAQ